jgi:hypothetical protein
MKAIQKVGVVSLACLFLLLLCGPVAAGQGEPILVEGTPSCESLGLTPFSYKVEPAESGIYGLDEYWGGLNTVTVTIPDLTFDWSTTLGIDAVIVKGGPDANLYTYTQESMSNAGYPSLHAPVNPGNGMYYDVTHIEFCFDYEVQVMTTAAPVFVREYAWSVSKSATETDLVLSPGETFTLPYSVVVSAAGFVDSDWAFTGGINIYNPAALSATITGVSDDLSGYPIPVDCGVTFPYTLVPFDTLSCTVEAPITNNSLSTNIVEVATTGEVGPGSASAVVDFTSASTDVTDECVTASDDLAGVLGAICAENNVPTTFSYSLDFGPYGQCGQYQFTNTASIVASDTGAVQSASWTVNVTVPCGGCTLSQGYWKTHSKYGPAPYDDAWEMVGEDTSFFLSGHTWYQMLWTPPVQGNAYAILTHAYIAAKLNTLNGAASTPMVNSALAWSENFFSDTGPSSNVSKSLRANALGYASLLDQYTNGLIGPGHCSE